MSTGDTRSCIINDEFVDTFPVYDTDGYTKVSGLNVNTAFETTWRRDGVEVANPTGFAITEIGTSGEYKIDVPANGLNALGFWQCEVAIPSNGQIWAVGIQVIENFMDVINALFQGSLSITFDINDEDDDPITDVYVQVFTDDLSRLVQAGRSNQSAGEFLTTLDPGDYKVILSKSLVVFSNPYSITVEDNDEAQTFELEGEPLVISTPASPELCTVYGYVRTMSGEYTDKIDVIVETVGTGSRSYVESTGGSGVDPEQWGISRGRKSVRPDRDTGVWQVSLVRGSYVRIVINQQGIDRVIRVPESETASFKDIPTNDPGDRISNR